MKFKEYIELSARTDADLGEKNELHWLLGIYNEFGETTGVIKKALVKGIKPDTTKLQDELADCCWYLAKGMRLNNFKIADDFAYASQNNILNLIATFNQFWQKKDLMGLFCCLVDLCDMYDLNFEQGLQNNIDKLKARHPNGFDINNKKHTVAEKAAIQK